LEIEQTTAIPAGTSHITLTVDDVQRLSMSSLDIRQVERKTKTYNLTPADIGVANKKFFLHTLTFPLASYNGKNLLVQAYNTQNQLIGQVNLAVTATRNKVTRLSGNIFFGAPVSFNIQINQEWQSPSIISF
jgi:hypothetical protein